MISNFLVLAATAAPEHGGSFDSIVRLIDGLGINVPALIAQMLNFTIVAYVLWRFGFKPVLATIDERQRKIADGLRYTEEMKAKLADAERQYAETMRKASLEAQRLVDDARSAAKELVDRETKLATERTQQMIARAEEAIALERRKMLAEVKDEISRLVAVTASRVLNRELTSDERRRYAESAARELSSV